MKAPASVESGDEADRIAGTPHPRFASRLIGHADHERDLLDAYRNFRLPHAIILGGAAGIGKATFAWRLAKFLLSFPDPAAPEVRDAHDLSLAQPTRGAAQAQSLSHPDLVLLRRELNEKTHRAYTEIRTDDVRRVISMFQRGAGAGGYRICIVDSAEDLNRSSANALLKLIEEPPPRSLFLVIAHRPGLVLPTIRSRARLLRFAGLSGADVAAVVATLGAPWQDHPPSAIAAAAAAAQGSVHDALRRIGQADAAFEGVLVRLLDRLPALDWAGVHKVADQVAGRDGEAAFELAMGTVYDWLARRVRGASQGSARRLAPYAEVWEKIAANARETEALNLDKRPLVLSIFSDLAAAVRASSA